jgi:hypothetical protein
MKVLLALFVLVAGLAAPAAAGEYTLENRPVVVFPGPNGIVHQTPYPQSQRSAAIWHNDACWRECSATCTAKMAACTPSAGADACRPHLDACDRSCQRSCRSFFARPVLDFVDW